MRSALVRLLNDLGTIGPQLTYLLAGLLILLLAFGLLEDPIRQARTRRPRGPDSGDPPSQVPWPLALLGALLVLVLIEFTVEAYFGRPLIPAIGLPALPTVRQS